MKKTRIISLVLALLLILSPLSAVYAQNADDIAIERISGSNRYLTAIETSKEGFSTSEYAVIASGANFPDALAGGQLAAYLNAPLLTVHPSGVSTQLFAELERLDVHTIYLLGGEAALSREIESTLAEQFTVKRLAGENRVRTSNEIATEIVKLYGDKPNVFYASADNFPDALSAGPLIPDQDGVMLLNRQVNEINGGIAIGGDAAVPGTPKSRIAGSNRYLTAVEIAKTYSAQSDSIILVSGTNYPDALAASGLAATTNQPILLTHPDFLSDAVRDYIVQEGITSVTVIGGDAAVSDTVLTEIRNLTKPSANLYDVVRVVDGDTIIIRFEGNEERVRLIGVDTPESVHPDPKRNDEFGLVASNFTKNLLTGKQVEIEFDVQERDHYGRLLAYVYVDGKMVNKTLLEAGMAQVATYPPNVKYVEEFKDLERVARETGVGLWGIIPDEPVTEPTPPVVDPEPPVEDTGGYGGRGLNYRWVDSNGNPLIKGNINAEGTKIYHTPNSPSYSKTKINVNAGERWFYTEQQALDAGWRAPKR